MERRSALVALVIGAGLVALPRLVGAQDAEGFDGYIQSGSCAAPTDDLRANLSSQGAHDVDPYYGIDRTSGEAVFVGYYGTPGLPGFGFANVYTEWQYSLVIVDTDNDAPVACGDILEPVVDEFGEAGLALVQLASTGGSTVHGVAAIERAALRREEDVTPTRVRILLSEGASFGPAAEPATGYDGYVQARSCAEPTEGVRVDLKSRGDHDVRPFESEAPDGEPVTVAYYGAPRVPGFHVASAHSDREIALFVTDTESGAPVACGDVLEPDGDDFTEAGLAVVRLEPTGNAGLPGFAVIERIGRERELDITPTRARIVLLAPSATSTSS
jgi:hypothetical protein